MDQQDSVGVSPRRRNSESGMTLIELLAVLSIISSLASIAVPKYHEVTESARVARAIGDLQALQTTLETRDTLPDLLSGSGQNLIDPWGNPYVYVKFPNGSPRLDQFGIPVNTTFDLYSAGPDKVSGLSLNSGPALDDIVRANDGGFISQAFRY